MFFLEIILNDDEGQDEPTIAKKAKKNTDGTLPKVYGSDKSSAKGKNTAEAKYVHKTQMCLHLFLQIST